jgi:hypothetical protein
MEKQQQQQQQTHSPRTNTINSKYTAQKCKGFWALVIGYVFFWGSEAPSSCLQRHSPAAVSARLDSHKNAPTFPTVRPPDTPHPTPRQPIDPLLAYLHLGFFAFSLRLSLKLLSTSRTTRNALIRALGGWWSRSNL